MATYLGHQEDSSGNILLPTPHSMATQIEFGTTASQAYAKGAYVVFNNRLCKASTAIASGDTLAIGTNLVQCSIGSELNSHLQAPNGDEFYFDYKDGKPGFYPSASKVASEFVPFGGSAEITYISAPSIHFNRPVTSLGDLSAYMVVIMIQTTNNSGSPVYPSSISCSGATLTQICAPSVERTALVVYQLTDLTNAVTITHGTAVGYSGNLTLIGLS